MVSLLDLAPAKKKVNLADGVDVEVRGLSVTDITVLLREYPELRKLIGGRGGSLNPADLLNRFPAAMAHVVAFGVAGSGATGADIDAAAGLPLGYSLPIVIAVIEETLGGDLDGPFVQKLLKVADQVEGAIGAGGKAPATKSPRASKS